MDNSYKGKLFLGFDISTQQVKAIILNAHLTPVFEDNVIFDRDFPEYQTKDGVHVQSDKLTVTSPTLMWVKAIEKILEKMKACNVSFKNIAAISGAGQQHGSVYWAKGAEATLKKLLSEKSMCEQLSNSFSVKNSPVWMDSSTTAKCKELEKSLGSPEELARITGSRAYERFTGNQIAKIYQVQRENYENTENISLVSSFGASLFTGKYAPIDYADGSGMNLMDIEKKSWSDICLDACAPSLRNLLLEPVASDTVVGKIADYMVKRYNFDPNCDVISFTGDNPASLAGMRLQKGEVIISLGTSDTLFLWLTQPSPKLEGHIFVNPTDSNEYMALLCYKNGSLTRQNIRNQCCSGSWEMFEQSLKSTPKGNNGNIGIYYDVAEITPLNACGIFRFNQCNEKVKTFSAKEEVRALIEGQFLAKRVHAELLGYKVASEKSRILATGGASENKEILQVIADIFHSNVYVLKVPNSASLGSAYIAKFGHEKLECPNLTFQECVKDAEPYTLAATPDETMREIYDDMTKRYLYLENKFIRTTFK